MEISFTGFDWVLLVGGLATLLYFYSTWTFDYFSKRSVLFLKPVPFFGSLTRTIFRKENQILNINRTYDAFPNSRYAGYYEFTKPVLMIRDPELIRQLGVKDFDYFLDHRSFVDEKHDPMFGGMLFWLKGQKWRDMRATLSPAFTGSKMRLMYSLVSDCSQQMANYLLLKSKTGPLELDMKDLFTRYTSDVIATSAFGIKVDSLGQPENEFYKMGKSVCNFSKLIIKFTAIAICPKLMKMLDIQVFDKEVSSYFRSLVLDTIKTREKENIIRPDMINLLMQARKGTLKHEAQVDHEGAGFATVQESSVGKESHKRVWTDDDLTAQAILFFLAGFETTSNLLCFAAHELAVNPDVQKILIEEIDESKQYGTPTYESIQKLKYLDMVTCEALRKWPPAPSLDRVCLKSYNVTDADGNTELVIDTGQIINIPVLAMHLDSQYYTDPERFDPERFSEKNKKNIKPFTYLPFGLGPRNCIGSRFALMESKAVLYHILSDFTFEVCSKTSIPLELTKKSFLMKPENGFWLEVKPRTIKT